MRPAELPKDCESFSCPTNVCQQSYALLRGENPLLEEDSEESSEASVAKEEEENGPTSNIDSLMLRPSTTEETTGEIYKTEEVTPLFKKTNRRESSSMKSIDFHDDGRSEMTFGRQIAFCLKNKKW